MINKSKLWFLMLSSIILVLAIYYIAVPYNNTDLVFNNVDNKDEETSLVMEESEAITAMKIQKEEEHLESTKVLQEILLNNTKSIQEKNEAYEKIKDLNNIKSLEEKLENNINEKYKLSSFVQIKDNKVKIVLANKEQSISLANEIIIYVNSLLDNKYYCTVKFE